MENQLETPSGVETDEEFPDEFQCCVCWDLLFKPVVLACGHVSCFWCVFRAMNLEVSNCPLCRHPYNHFPSICRLLHFALLKLYPKAYKRREQQMLEEEKRSENFSPQLDNCVGSKSREGESSTTRGPESSLVFHKEDQMTIPVEPDFERAENVASRKSSMLREVLNIQNNSQQLLITDFYCVACKELLYQPVVLNCGHVYCEVCIISPSDRVPRCQVCQSAHPNGWPKVCLLLKNLLEEQFSQQYALRKENVYKHGLIQSQNNVAMLPSIATNPYRSWLSGRGPKLHIGVGCDYCGMYPIIGERYKCKDCKEKIGFDLCEGCYNSSSKLPGRFNQQHTPEHKLEIVQLHPLPNVVPRLIDLEIDENDSDSPDGMGGFAYTPDFVPEEDSASQTSSHEISSQDTSENEEDGHSSM